MATDLINEFLKNFFSSFSLAPPEVSREEVSPRRGETYAAPCSVYDSRRSTIDYFSSGVQNGSVCEPGSICEAGSVCEASVCEPKALRSWAQSGDDRPSPVPLFEEPRHESLIIPFKDGSSQIIMSRPSFLQASDPQLRLKGASFLLSEAYKQRDTQFFISDPEDIVDVKVAEYFKAKPHVYTDTKFTRIRPGVYSMKRDGCPSREVEVEWFGKGHKGQLQITDGAVKQPFAAYFDKKDPTAASSTNYAPPAQQAPAPQHAPHHYAPPPQHAPGPQYGGSIFKAKNNLQTIPKECRVTFNDAGFDYSRIDAMKVAKEQALLREDAARMMKQDRQVPQLQRIESRYEKTMDLKLGVGSGPRTRRHTEVSIPTAPSWGSVGAPPMHTTVRMNTAATSRFPQR